MQFCSETLKAIRRLYEGVDGAHGIEVKAVSEHDPKGKEQDCVLATGGVEWVDQHGPGMVGDEFWGTVTWRLGDHYLITHFAT